MISEWLVVNLKSYIRENDFFQNDEIIQRSPEAIFNVKTYFLNPRAFKGRNGEKYLFLHIPALENPNVKNGEKYMVVLRKCSFIDL